MPSAVPPFSFSIQTGNIYSLQAFIMICVLRNRCLNPIDTILVFMRAFLGISTLEDLKPRICEIQKKFDGLDIKFVEMENLHFNLKFFRQLEEGKIEELKAKIEKACSMFESFEIEIKGIGAFPSKNYVRVVWLGVKEGLHTFKALAEAVDSSIGEMGFEKEKQFVPHLTLGRVRSGRNKEEIRKLMDKLEDVEIGKMKVDKLTLFQSKLSPEGPLYKEVFNVNL